MDKQRKAHLILLITATIWGLSFAAQSAGLNHMGPFSFNAIRYYLGALVLLPFILARKVKLTSSLIKSGLAIGLVLSIASSLQQFALQEASAGKAGFITGLYIVFVPFLSFLFGQKVRKENFIALVIGLIGLSLMSFTNMGGIAWPDVFLLVSSLFFAFHIIAIGKFGPGQDPLALSAIQFLTAGSVSLLLSLLTETINIADIQAAMWPIIYAGAFSCGIGYTLQIIGQKDSNPTTASLIMSLESVFSVVGGAVFLGERLSGRQLLGCLFMLIAVFYSALKDASNIKQKGTSIKEGV